MIDDDVFLMKITSDVCHRCRHFRKVEFDLGGIREGKLFRPRPTCNAFPYKIPDEIWHEQNDHTMPYPGDQGIQFEDSGVHPPRSAKAIY